MKKSYGTYTRGEATFVARAPLDEWAKFGLKVASHLYARNERRRGFASPPEDAPLRSSPRARHVHVHVHVLDAAPLVFPPPEK